MKKRHTSRNLKTNPGRYERFTPRRKAENNGRILSSLSEITKTELNAVHLRINEEDCKALDNTDERKDLAYGFDGIEPELSGSSANTYVLSHCLEENFIILAKAGLLNIDTLDLEADIENNLIKEWRTFLKEWVNHH